LLVCLTCEGFAALTPEQFRAARIEADLSVEWLAWLGGISSDAVTRLEKGRPVRERTREAVLRVLQEHRVALDKTATRDMEGAVMARKSRVINVSGEPVELSVAKKHGQSWIASGTYMGETYQSQGRSEGSALGLWREWAAQRRRVAMAPDDIMVRGDDEGGWFLHHPDHGQSGPLPTMQTALRQAVELGRAHDLGVSVQTVAGTEEPYWSVGQPLPELPDE